jgi:hypothetical protein
VKKTGAHHRYKLEAVLSELIQLGVGHQTTLSAVTNSAPHWCDDRSMSLSRITRSSKAKAARQSVTIPAPLLAEVRRVAKERKLTMSRAMVFPAGRGIQADIEAKQNLQAAYKRFMKEQKPGAKDEAGTDLVRAIFGTGAIAEAMLR